MYVSMIKRAAGCITYSFIAQLIFVNVILAQSLGDTKNLDEFIENQRERYHIPGIAAYVVKNTEIIWAESYNWADFENNVPMSTSGIINIGSISKTFTATAIMQLWGEGTIHLAADVNEYLAFNIRNPFFPDSPITIQQL